MRQQRVSAIRLALIGVLLIPSAMQAQGLRGVVVDSAGRPLAEADVILGDPGSRTRTDSLGEFRFSGTDTGRQRLRVRLIGYRPFETTVTIRDERWTELRVTLNHTPQVLGEVRVTDTRLCSPNTIAGFECRRQSGKGMFRDAGQIRSLKPDAWTDMLDGMPDIRRQPVMTPDGLDWRPRAPPGKCLRVIYNGENPMFDGHVRKVPESYLVPLDVIAIEYYVEYADVPEAFKRYAWPRTSTGPCALIVYWLKQEEEERQRPQRLDRRLPPPSAPPRDMQVNMIQGHSFSPSRSQ